MSRTLRYRPELDGLRAIAVVLVIVHHCWQPQRFAGFVGVDVFFALSGFLITSILMREVDRRGGVALGSFYLKRLLRLYPALLSMLLVTLLAYHWLAPTLGTLLKDAAVAATYTSNIYMTYRGHWIGPYTHTWSLALEEQYYLIWPLVLVLVLRTGLRRGALAVVMLIAASASAALSVRDFTFGASVFPVQSTAVGLLLGSAFALGIEASPALRRAVGSRLAAAGAIVVLAAVLVVFSLTTAIPDGGYVPATVLATVAIIGFTGAHGGRDVVSRALAVRPLVALGRISYGIYLWHYPLVILLGREAAGWDARERLAVVLPLAVVVAAASYRFVEAPFLRRKDQLGVRGVVSSTSGPSVDTAAR